jgi:hypothetical protein
LPCALEAGVGGHRQHESSILFERVEPISADLALARAFEKGGWDRVTRFYRTDDIADDRCWVKGSG